MISAKYGSRLLLRTAESSILGEPFERMASGAPFSAVNADLASSKAAGMRYACMRRSSCRSVASIESCRTAKRRAASVICQKSSYRSMRARSQVYSSCFCLHSCESAPKSPEMLACSRWTTEWTSKSVPYASNMKAWGLKGIGFHSGQRSLEPRRSDGGTDEHSHSQLPSECVHHDAAPVGDFDQP